MRLHLLLAATTLFATPPAMAGITAHYRLGEGPDGPRMVIEVNDRGDSQTVMGDGTIMIQLGGIAYLVETDSEGTYVVLLEDAMFQVDGSRRPSHGPVADRPQSPEPRVALRRGGTEIVGGHRGTVWRIYHPAAPEGDGGDYVVSADPDLRPLNAVLGPRRAPDPAADPTGAAAARWSIYQRGAVLREGRHLRLERAEIRPNPAAFTLPGPVLDRAAYAARRRRAGH